MTMREEQTPTKRPLMPLSPASATSTRSFTSTASASTGNISFSPSSSSAPTPFNTFQQQDAFDSRSFAGTDNDSNSVFRGDASPTSSSHGNLIYGMNSTPDVHPDDSIGPSYASSQGTNSRQLSMLSSHASSHLLPYSRTTSSSSPIPTSKRPIPAPPVVITPSTPRSGESITQFSETTSIPAPFVPLDGALSSRGDVESMSSQALGTGQDRDSFRLQQLGYDAVLGRDYTFWSSLSIAWLNIGCLQVGLHCL